MPLKGKKLLILGGTYQQKKFVECAKRLGIYTIVVDYLVDSPAKKNADKSYNCDIKDIEQLVKICNSEKIDGVITGYIDPAQRPYNELCDRLNLPCLATKSQYLKMTDKKLFKAMCKESGVGIIEDYTEDDVVQNNIKFPVFVKPVDSRGSRGQSICYTKEDLIKAIDFAKENSSNGEIIIEKYIEDAQEFQVTYFYINGKPHLIRTVDSYKGLKENNLDKVVLCAVSPSVNTEEYMLVEHSKVINMFKNLGIKNGPIFMQGFKVGNEFKFFDPGLRFPGVDYERIYNKVFNIDLMELLINFALSGKMPNAELPVDSVYLKGKKAAVLFPNIKAGNIKNILDTKIKQNNTSIISYIPRYNLNDKVTWSYDINQRFAEIDILEDDIQKLSNTVNLVYDNLSVLDNNNDEMIFQKFETKKLRG